MSGLCGRVLTAGILGALLAGCGGTGINFLDDFRRVVVEPVGRSFSEFGDRLRIDVPRGAYRVDVTFLIARVVGLPSWLSILFDTAFDVRVEGPRGDRPVRITLRYDERALPPDTPAEWLTLVEVLGGATREVPGSVVDPVEKTVSAEVLDPRGTYAIAIRAERPPEGESPGP